MRRRSQRTAAIAALVATASLTIATLAAGAQPAEGAQLAEDGCAEPSGTFTEAEPWHSRLFGVERLWQLSTGRGITVAILASGVDAGHPQFGAGQVGDGIDLLGTGPAARDCDGRGTFAAGLIAARVAPDTPVAGLAPDAVILPVRVTESTDEVNADDDADPDAADPRLVAQAMTAAAAEADVVCVVTPVGSDGGPEAEAAIASAVQAAEDADALLVVPPATLPEAPGVVTVGGIGSDGRRLGADEGSEVGRPPGDTGDTDVLAPGSDLVSIAPNGTGDPPGHVWPVREPSFAVAFGCGAAALVRSYRPELDAVEVAGRIRGTATVRGVLDINAAVTSERAEAAASADAGEAADAGGSPLIRAAEPTRITTDSLPIVVGALGILAMTGLLLLIRLLRS